MHKTYATHVLPQSDSADTATYAEAYSQLRLKGLQQSPGSFSSTFEEELRLSNDEKIERLLRKKRSVIIAAVDSGDSTPLCSQEWVGSVTILGPMTRDEYLAPFADKDLKSQWPSLATTTKSAASNSKTISYWHMTALYVDATHRRQGLAKKLCDAAFQMIEQETEHSLHELRIIIKHGNFGVAQMYEALDFAAIELNATLAEAVTASGEADVEAEVLAREPKYLVREGLIMLKYL